MITPCLFRCFCCHGRVLTATSLCPCTASERPGHGGEAAPSCFYWLHVHSANPNVIHIESTADRVFTLGDFFKVWDAWSTYSNGPHELLDPTHVSTLTVGAGQSMTVYIDLGDGKGAQLYEGDPSTIVLKSHEIVTIEITPPTVTPPPAFDWKSSTNNGL